MSDVMRPSLGILQCGHAPAELVEKGPDIPELFIRTLGADAFDYRVWAVVDGEPLPEPAAADAWLITGSRHGVYEDHAWIAPLESLVRAIRDDERPLVGICFGHQLIAQALGGRVEKFAGGWSVGRVGYRLDDLSGGAGDGVSARPAAASREDDAVPLVAYHQDQVVEPPPGARTLGSSEVCRHAALAIGDTIRTLQPHPEFDVDFVAALFETRGRNLPPESLARGLASLEAADDIERARLAIAAELRAFLLEGIRVRGRAPGRAR